MCPLTYSSSAGGLLPPPLPLLVINHQFWMGRCGWGMAAPEETGPPTDRVQRSPRRPYPDPPVKDWVISLIRGGTTYSGWYMKHRYMGTYPVASPNRGQNSTSTHPPGRESHQWGNYKDTFSCYGPHSSYGMVGGGGWHTCKSYR